MVSISSIEAIGKGLTNTSTTVLRSSQGASESRLYSNMYKPLDSFKTSNRPFAGSNPPPFEVTAEVSCQKPPASEPSNKSFKSTDS